jgi:DNA replication and repair protein RecF
MIKDLKLMNFRSFEKKDLTFSPNVTVIVGPNAAGKTNILESVFLLATGKSFKAKREEEMIGYEKDMARVKGVVRNLKSGKTGLFDADTENISQDIDLEIVLTRGEIEITQGQTQKAPRKKLMVNGVPRRLLDFAGNFTVVLFAPSDMELVTESPSVRRRFLDTVLCQTDREYRRNLLSYEKGLKQRNRILYNIRENGISRSQLVFWNQLLVKAGDYISRKREEFISYVNERESLNENLYQLEYDKSSISEARLEQYKVEEVASATTLVGPHRDDMQFSIFNSQFSNGNKRDLATYGSRGEQRMGVLWLKMAELSYINETLGSMPTLLLDDIFSELDHQHRDVVMEIIDNTQTIMTTADPHHIENIQGASIITL